MFPEEQLRVNQQQILRTGVYPMRITDRSSHLLENHLRKYGTVSVFPRAMQHYEDLKHC